MKLEPRALLELVAAGQLSPERANELLRELESRPRSSRWWWLINPCERLSTPWALVLSSGAMAAALALSRANLRFSGMRDVWKVDDSFSWSIAVADNLVAWPLVALVFWGTSLLVARQGRFVDFLASVGISRIPLVLMGAVGAVTLPHPDRMTNLAITISLVIPTTAWNVILLLQGYRTASGLRGARMVVFFLTALLAASLVAKLSVVAVERLL